MQAYLCFKVDPLTIFEALHRTPTSEVPLKSVPLDHSSGSSSCRLCTPSCDTYSPTVGLVSVLTLEKQCTIEVICYPSGVLLRPVLSLFSYEILLIRSQVSAPSDWSSYHCTTGTSETSDRPNVLLQGVGDVGTRFFSVLIIIVVRVLTTLLNYSLYTKFHRL